MYFNVRAIVERQMPDGSTAVLLQVRDKPGEPRVLELPGGRLEEYEPLLAGLARELLEETGLQLAKVLGSPACSTTTEADLSLEFIEPFCVYQTTKGPIDSVGVFFRCEAEGQLREMGDGARSPRWVAFEQLKEEAEKAPERYHWLTRGALRYYFGWCERNNSTAG